MNRLITGTMAALLVLPGIAHAQRPSATVQTRSAELYMAQAEKTQVTAERQKLYQQALEKAVEGVQAQPSNSKTWYTLGVVYGAMGDAIGADSAFDKAGTLWADYAEEIEQERFRAFVNAFNAGVTAIQQNKPEEAIVKLEAANAVYDKKPTAALNLGNLYARANQIDKAAGAYRQALQILRGPEREKLVEAEKKQWSEWEEAASYNLAQMLASTGKDAEAVQAYQDYLAAHPKNVVARGNLAVVLSRMGKQDEAAKVYADLLGQDLTDEEYFQVGVGLFRGKQHAQAADAFRKAIAKNPSMRDAYYNLAQSIYAQVETLEEARTKAKPADAKTMDAQLKGMYAELQTAAESARALDPANRNVLALLARGYRGMADVVDAKAATEWKNKTLAVMKAHQELPYEVTDLSLTTESGEIKLSGNIVNLKSTEGQPISLTFTFLGRDGQVIGTQDVTVTAPKVEDQVPFTVSVKSEAALGGWKYAMK